MGTGTDQFMDACRKQAEMGAEMMDAIVQATAKMRSVQLAAANETHDATLALEKSLAAAKSGQELWMAQWEWALGASRRSADYWRSLFEAMNEANGMVARCAQCGMQAAAPSGTAGEALPAGFAGMDSMYRDMLKASQQLMQYTTGALGVSANPSGAGSSGAKKAA